MVDDSSLGVEKGSRSNLWKILGFCVIVVLFVCLISFQNIFVPKKAGQVLAGGGSALASGVNPFDQDLNTFNSPHFDTLHVTNLSTADINFLNGFKFVEVNDTVCLLNSLGDVSSCFSSLGIDSVSWSSLRGVPLILNGTNGRDGLNGTNGVNGLNGTNGLNGSKGDTGNQGGQGIQGLQGLQGNAGANGLNGLNGTNGINGLNGTNGQNGVNGINGTSINITSVTWSSGNFTMLWSNGFSFISPNLTGSKGDTGSQGIQGLQGIAGINGTNGVNGLNGTNGINGLNGTNGAQGIQGIAGLNGTNGVNGIDGTNAFNITNNITNNITSILNPFNQVLNTTSNVSFNNMNVTTSITTLGNISASFISANLSKGSSTNLSSVINTLAVVNGGTGVTKATGTDSVVLNNTPTIKSPRIMFNFTISNATGGLYCAKLNTTNNGWIFTTGAC